MGMLKDARQLKDALDGTKAVLESIHAYLEHQLEVQREIKQTLVELQSQFKDYASYVGVKDGQGDKDTDN